MLSDGTQFWVMEFLKSGIAIMMAEPGTYDMDKTIIDHLTPENQGAFNTPDLQKFQQSIPLAKPGLYQWKDTFIRLYHDLVMYKNVYVKQGASKPTWLNERSYNPDDWQANKPRLVKNFSGFYWGAHPAGPGLKDAGYHFMVARRSNLWNCYDAGGYDLPVLSNDEISRLVRSKVLEPVKL